MTITLVKRPLACLVAAMISLTGFGALAEEAPTQGVLESFACSYKDGKDRDDLNSAIEYHLKQAEKAGITPVPAYLWTKFKGTAEAEMIWHNLYESMAAFGAQMDAEAASSEIASANDRYLSVVDCTPLLGRVSPVQVREGADGGDGSFVVSYACRTLQAPNQDAFMDLNRHISGVLGSMGEAGPLGTYVITPLTTDADGPNAVYINVFENVSQFADFDAQLTGTDAGQMLVRHFGTMLSCSSNMWGSEQVIGATE